jgi:phage terminase large subunit-like protein
VAGRIVACKWVKLACQRHINDLVRAKTGGPFVFDEARANHKCRFIERLPHVKGDWASRNEKISLGPWQCFIVCSLFGWVRRTDGARRFREAYLAVPRKNAKSTLAAGIGNAMFCADGEFGAEVFSGATTEDQAWEVFRPAKQMVERTPDLKEAFGIYTGKPGSNASTMSIPANGSRFEPVIGKPGDGASPHCAIVDEYHEHDSAVLFDTMKTGMGARKQPLLLVITTAGDNLAGPCRALQQDVEKVLAGSLDRDDLFGLIYTIDAGDDWTSAEALRKANPNYDVSVYGDYLLSQQKIAVSDARKQNVFKTKHLNIWCGASVAFINMERWNEMADTSLDPDEFRGCPCVVAADLSSTKDITARVLVFKKLIEGKDHYFAFGRFYLPEDQASKQEFQHYQAWVSRGFLKATPGEVIDYEQFTSDTIEDVVRFQARELCYDPWNAEQYAQKVEKATRSIRVKVDQKVQYLSEPMKQMDLLITDRRLHHDGNPVFTWMIGNLTAHEDVNGNVFPRKERYENKIDGAVALIMALSRSMAMPNQAARSVYSTRGLLTL